MKSLSAIVFALLLMALVLSVACGPGAQGGGAAAAPTAKPAGDAAKGKTTFAGTCASCHGPDAKGLPNLGKDLTTSQFVKDETDAQLLAFLKVGRPASDPANTTKVDMPPKGGNPALTDADLNNIVAFLRTINQ